MNDINIRQRDNCEGQEEGKKSLKKDRKMDTYNDMTEQDTVLCMKCAKRFMNLADIYYLQECMHTICKLDLKNLIFQ